jgi:hypothetical protein
MKEEPVVTQPLILDNLPPPPEKEVFTALGFQKNQNKEEVQDAHRS